MTVIRHISNALLATCLITFNQAIAAPTSDLAIPQGHVADFLFLTDRAGADSYKKSYFAEIGPLGRKLGYKPVTSFRITQKPISGYYFPSILAVASWPGDWNKRQALFDDLLELQPDIRSRRQDIWSTFNMMNYEVKEDINFAFDPQKTYVFGAYWAQHSDTTHDYKSTMLNEIKQAGGRVKVQFNGGETMFGYLEAPDFSLITEWKSQTAFEQFHQKYQQLRNNTVKLANEYYLDVI